MMNCKNTTLYKIYYITIIARMNVFSHYLTVKLKVPKMSTEKQETFVPFLILEYPTSF